MFQVGDHAILINGMFNDFHGVGWVESTMTRRVGMEFVIRKIIREYRDIYGNCYQVVSLNDLDGNRVSWVYDSAWLVPVNQLEPDAQELDDMFSEFV